MSCGTQACPRADDNALLRVGKLVGVTDIAERMARPLPPFDLDAVKARLFQARERSNSIVRYSPERRGNPDSSVALDGAPDTVARQ